MTGLSRSIPLIILFLFSGGSALQAQGPYSSPPNAPALLHFANGQLQIRYSQDNILSAKVKNSSVVFRHIENKYEDKVEQVFLFESKTAEDFELTGIIKASPESFACEVDCPPSFNPIVRHSSGSSTNLLNRAVYDRGKDWVISFDLPYPVTVKPIPSPKGVLWYQFTVKASRLAIRFRPRFYQKHKGLQYFEPWTYQVWEKPVVGWSSWYAYFNRVTEQNIHEVADSLSNTLLRFGYQYLQIDDGYQQEPIGKPGHWLQPNQKFPAGLQDLSHYIKSKGLKPGIWTNVACADSSFAYSNAPFYIKDPNGHPAFGEWVGYAMDGSNSSAINTLVNPVYHTLRREGWEYFKVDALRHLRYEGYNTYGSYFSKKLVDPDVAFRKVVQAIRQNIGKDNYLLACWGIRPELIGLVDGCRLGNDGFSYAGLAQYNSFNNVVWRNDPDHVELTDAEAFRSCTVTSLTGSVLLLTDKPARYKGRVLEAARRTSPVLFTKPGQIFEVDPSRIRELARYRSEISGGGPRVFDAGYTPITELYSLEINRPFENWMVLGRMSNKNSKINLAELGLSPSKEYEVFEFWTKKDLGTCKKEFYFPDIDSQYNCQVFCFREKLDHPQLLATNRHISCGGLELKECQWSQQVLSGVSELTPNDEYKLYFHIPAGFKVKTITTDLPYQTIQDGNLLVVSMITDHPADINWKIEFSN